MSLGSSAENPLKVFMLEDNLDDVELELYELRKGNLHVTHEVARNRTEFLSKLPGFDPDIILADYALPDITGVEAINHAREMGINSPVMLITGEGNESIAVDSLRLGAVDYILKKNIAGLPARVRRAVEIWEDRKAKRRAESEEMRLQQLLFENQKMEAIGRLAGGIAHDFNNILTGVMGFAEICIMDIPDDVHLRNKLESIISLSRKGADLVKQLMIFSKKMVLEFKRVDMNFFVADTINFLKRIVEETIEIRLDLHQNLPLIACDTNQFTQVLMNLVLNARDAMDGSGVITIKTSRCRMNNHQSGRTASPDDMDCVCISVSDTGAGIDEHHLSRVFDPFFTTKDVGKGTGLGLSIVYSVVQSHGGTVTVESKKGEGTTFKIMLPIQKQDDSEDDSPFYERLPEANNRISGHESILVVEDEDVLRDLLSHFFGTLGYKVTTARDGAEAMSLYISDPDKYHMIISDMMMPNKNGIEFFQEARAVRPAANFILATGYSLADVDEEILSGMTAVIKKPYAPMQLVKIIREIFDSQS